MTMDLPFLSQHPRIPDSCYIDLIARINGGVEMGETCSVWFNVAIRGDVNSIRIGTQTNIQDLCVLHTSLGTHPLQIGDDVTLGHSVIAHGCTIGNRVLVGMQTTILDGAVIGDDVLIGAGSLVTQNKSIPSGVMAFGRPAKVVRELTVEERTMIADRAVHYAQTAEAYARAGRFHAWGDNPFYQK